MRIEPSRGARRAEGTTMPWQNPWTPALGRRSVRGSLDKVSTPLGVTLIRQNVLPGKNHQRIGELPSDGRQRPQQQIGPLLLDKTPGIADHPASAGLEPLPQSLNGRR